MCVFATKRIFLYFEKNLRNEKAIRIYTGIDYNGWLWQKSIS